MDLTLIGLQDRDFRLPPVAGPCLGPDGSDRTWIRPPSTDTIATAGEGRFGVGDGVLLHQGPPLVRRDGRVALVDPLPADPLDQPLDRLGLDLQVGQFGQIADAC